jgi:periplasmic divalent cation tolerance protein
MTMFYVNLQSADEARDISRVLIERGLAVCCNFTPTTYIYRRERGLSEERQAVLIITTRNGYRGRIEDVIREFASYTKCIAEIEPESINAEFRDWLHAEVPPIHALQQNPTDDDPFRD